MKTKLERIHEYVKSILILFLHEKTIEIKMRINILNHSVRTNYQ